MEDIEELALGSAPESQVSGSINKSLKKKDIEELGSAGESKVSGSLNKTLKNPLKKKKTLKSLVPPGRAKSVHPCGQDGSKISPENTLYMRIHLV